jgi:serpin B
VFSPLSIYSALSLAAAGARGSTLAELLDALGAKSRDSLAENVRDMVDRALPGRGGGGGPCVAYSCGLWHDTTKTLKPAYRNVIAVSCNAVVHAVDFIT